LAYCLLGQLFESFYIVVHTDLQNLSIPQLFFYSYFVLASWPPYVRDR